MKTVAQEYATYVKNLQYRDIPAQTIERAKDVILDTVGCIVQGVQTEEGKITKMAIEGYGKAFNPLLLGTYAHSQDFDDTHNASCIHVGGVVVAAALALLKETSFDGPTFLKAIISGYDIAAKIGIVADPHVMYSRGFHPTGVMGAFGSATVAGVVYELDEEKMAYALGLAGSGISGLQEYLANGAMNKRLHAGLAALHGIVAARLAKHGFTGPLTIVEGDRGFLATHSHAIEDTGILTDSLGKKFEINDSHIKLYPCNSGFHTSIEALLDIVLANHLAPRDIKAIKAGWRGSLSSLKDVHNPTTILGAQMSMPYVLAVSILDRKFDDVNQFSETYLHNPQVKELMQKITLEVNEDLIEKWHADGNAFASLIELTTADGRTFTKGIDYPMDGPGRTTPKSKLTDKFLKQTVPVIGKEKADFVIEFVKNIETYAELKPLTDALAVVFIA